MAIHQFYGLTRTGLSSLLQDQGLGKSPAATELFRLFYRKTLGGDSNPQDAFENSHQLSSQFVGSWRSHFLTTLPTVIFENRSRYDGSVKFLLELEDKKTIEMVLMPEKSRITLCVSSQVGCAQGCVFCHTARMGLVRNLRAWEIVGQVQLANFWIMKNPDWLIDMNLKGAVSKVSNVVFMGMGEPLDNVAEVHQAVKIMTDPFGLALAPRKVTISTAGHLAGLKELIRDPSFNSSLALSLHNPFAKERARIMPIERHSPLAAVLEELKPFAQKRGLLIQYTLIKDRNDSPNHAHALADLLAGIPVKVNLIPLNPIHASRLEEPEHEHIKIFQTILLQRGFRTMVRYSKGQDILGACGQLVIAKQVGSY